MTKYNEAAQRITDFLDLRLDIQAVRMIEDPAEVPASAEIARETYGHLALCQAFALAKRQGITVYTDKFSEWCWAPVVSLGYGDAGPGTKTFATISRLLGIQDQEKADRFFEEFPRLPLGKYQGALIGPATEAEFTPHVLLINCDNNFQFRTLVSLIKYKTGKLLDAHFDTIDSCVHTLVAAMVSKDYAVAVPDPGDQERALAGDNEIILAVPAEKLDELMEGLDFVEKRHGGRHRYYAEMTFEFPRPPFYNDVFAEWGLEQGNDWRRPGK